MPVCVCETSDVVCDSDVVCAIVCPSAVGSVILYRLEAHVCILKVYKDSPIL